MVQTLKFEVKKVEVLESPTTKLMIYSTIYTLFTLFFGTVYLRVITDQVRFRFLLSVHCLSSSISHLLSYYTHFYDIDDFPFQLSFLFDKEKGKTGLSWMDRDDETDYLIK